VRDDEAAGDVLQDVLLTICRKLPELRDPRWLRAWAYRIATRAAVRRARRERRWRDALRGEEAAEAIDAGAAPLADPPFDAELVAQVPALLETLSPAARTVVRMHYLDQLSLVEIAEAIEVPLGTVKSRLAYGLAALRGRLLANQRGDVETR
jgi:RNA polymerase sigma-70 factor (ECF subfamily)